MTSVDYTPVPSLESLQKRVAELEAENRSLKWDNTADEPLPEDGAINAAHPVNSGNHEAYREAMRLVGARRSKGALVALVCWLLSRANDDRATELEARELELVEQLRRVANVNSAAVAIMEAVSNMHSYEPGEAATIKQAQGWLRAHENTKGFADGYAIDPEADVQALVDEMEKIAKSDPGEGGCYYTNQINISRARKALAKFKETKHD